MHILPVVYSSDGETVTEIAKGSTGNITLTATWKGPAYVRVDKNQNPDANGEYILFGSYPQTVTKNAEIQKALNEKAGDLPKDGDNGKWTPYEYYYGKEVGEGKREISCETKFMWYTDVEYSGEKYRGVYFTYYRPNVAMNVLQDDSASYLYSYQKKNGYRIGVAYWFKYEPILWQIIGTKDGKAQLLCMSAIDSQPYALATKKSGNTITDELDNHYVYYNVGPGVPQNTLGSNYEHSAIRSWLNGCFYDNAFDSFEKTLVCETTIDNQTGDVGENTLDKVFIPSIAELEAVKNDLYRKSSDYSDSQGALNSSWDYSCAYYTRDTYYVLRFNKKEDMISYDRDRYKWTCAVSGSALYNSLSKKPTSTGVEATSNAVVPSLWITL